MCLRVALISASSLTPPPHHDDAVERGNRSAVYSIWAAAEGSTKLGLSSERFHRRWKHGKTYKKCLRVVFAIATLEVHPIEN